SARSTCASKPPDDTRSIGHHRDAHVHDHPTPDERPSMTDQALDILKLVLLALLYLFFARVLWAVWSEVRQPANARQQADTPAPAPVPPTAAPGPGRRDVREPKPPKGRR